MSQQRPSIFYFKVTVGSSSTEIYTLVVNYEIFKNLSKHMIASLIARQSIPRVDQWDRSIYCNLSPLLARGITVNFSLRRIPNCYPRDQHSCLIRSIVERDERPEQRNNAYYRLHMPPLFDVAGKQQSLGMGSTPICTYKSEPNSISMFLLYYLNISEYFRILLENKDVPVGKIGTYLFTCLNEIWKSRTEQKERASFC